MSINNSQRAGFPAELIETMTGSWITIGTLEHVPVLIIFDNQGSATTQISIDGGDTTWRTFPGGEALVLDLRDKRALAANFGIDQGTTFSGNGASGAFSISYVYAKEM